MKNVRLTHRRPETKRDNANRNAHGFSHFQQLRLKPGRIVRKMYEKVPFPLVYKIFIFDIQNKEGILNGEKPKFLEVGPYTF